MPLTASLMGWGRGHGPPDTLWLQPTGYSPLAFAMISSATLRGTSP